MVAAYFDTSVLYRRYDRTEPGAARVRSFAQPSRRNTVVVARIASVEMASALARQEREGRLPAAYRAQLWRLFLAHWTSEYLVIAATEDIYEEAERLLFRHPLRAIDALHVASCLVARSRLRRTSFRFWTADQRQAAAAQAEGLDVELLA